MSDVVKKISDFVTGKDIDARHEKLMRQVKNLKSLHDDEITRLRARLAPVEDEALVEIAVKEVERVIASANDSETVGGARWKALRVAIAAIRPHIEAAERERCAKAVKTVAEKINVAPHERPEYEDGYLQGVHDAAAAIRSWK